MQDKFGLLSTNVYVRRMYVLIKCEIPSKEVREGFVNAPDSLMIDKLMNTNLSVHTLYQHSYVSSLSQSIKLGQDSSSHVL